MELEEALAILNGKERSILVAEDSESNVMLIQLYFSKTACTLDVAENGQEAVDMFQSKDYSLILMDIQMPVMDGYAATNRIREIEEERDAIPVPIIAVTATIHGDEQARCLKAGCTDFLPKPISKSSLLGCVAWYVKQD